MKVKAVQSKPAAPAAAKANPVTGIQFSEIMDQSDFKQSKEHLEHLLKNIQSEGKKLADAKTIESLIYYKKLVKSFLEDALKMSLKIEERRGYSRVGRTKALKIISMVDEKLIELTDEFLSTERKGIRLLEKVGELQGLLVNLLA